MAFDGNLFGSGLGSMLGGLFGHSDRPYDKAMEEYSKYSALARQQQQPFVNAGREAIPRYQEWLQGQEDPTAFINNLMGDYQESPYANYLQQQSMRSGQNAASASGLSGSTPLFQQLQQNSNNISSADMGQWLQNVLGINNQYGQGQQNLITGGQGAANNLSDLYSNLGSQLGEQAYNREGSKQNSFWNTLGGIGSMIGSFF